jgi:hypothetical protein
MTRENIDFVDVITLHLCGTSPAAEKYLIWTVVEYIFVF